MANIANLNRTTTIRAKMATVVTATANLPAPKVCGGSGQSSVFSSLYQLFVLSLDANEGARWKCWRCNPLSMTKLWWTSKMRRWGESPTCSQLMPSQVWCNNLIWWSSLCCSNSLRCINLRWFQQAIKTWRHQSIKLVIFLWLQFTKHKVRIQVSPLLFTNNPLRCEISNSFK